MVRRELRTIGSGIAAEAVSRLMAVTRLDTLEELLHFGFAQRPAWDVVEVIVQDEFTHDVVVCGPVPAFLVFDTT